MAEMQTKHTNDFVPPLYQRHTDKCLYKPHTGNGIQPSLKAWEINLVRTARYYRTAAVAACLLAW